MALVTQADIEEYTGFKYSDFTESGLEMTAGQWASFVASLIPKVTQMLHRYCNVTSFESLETTEYHSGKGATDYDSQVSDYNEEDRMFFLRQLYVNDGSLLVYEDTASKSGVPVWTSRSERPNGALAEIDTLVVTGIPTVNGNITITLNGVTSYTVAVTTAMTTIAAVCAAIVAAGAKTDSTGVVWTPGGLSPYVTLTAGTTGAATLATFSAGTTGVTATMYRTTKGTAAAGGDYEVYCENDVTRLYYNTNVPALGSRNVKFVYNTGYSASSAQLNDVKFQCLRAIKNVLLTKKKIQEATTIRNFGVRDYSQMFDVFSESVVLDDKVKAGLEMYRRAVIPGTFTYE
jgi:hypothetical protein